MKNKELLAVLNLETIDGFINEAVVIPNEVLMELAIVLRDKRLVSGVVTFGSERYRGITLDDIEFTELPTEEIQRIKKYGVINEYEGGYIQQIITTSIAQE